MKNTSEELRAFTLGIVAGVAILIGALFAISYANDIRWQPVKIERN